jgi:hypothetical protein
MHARGSTNRLMPQHASLFAQASLFGEIARTVCSAGVLPRKELYEAWELGRRAHRLWRNHHGRIVDFACGHGLLAHVAALLWSESLVVACDVRFPPSYDVLHQAMAARWPALARVSASADVVLAKNDLVLSCHACGSLTDDVLQRCSDVGANVAVMPCCHEHPHPDKPRHALSGWLQADMTIDIARAMRMQAAGYHVTTQQISDDITQKNRLLLCAR